MSSGNFQIIENLRESQEILNIFKLWETQNSFDFFFKFKGSFEIFRKPQESF